MVFVTKVEMDVIVTVILIIITVIVIAHPHYHLYHHRHHHMMCTVDFIIMSIIPVLWEGEHQRRDTSRSRELPLCLVVEN